MKYWYKNESWRLLPNIEIYHDIEMEVLCFDIVWCKWVITLPIYIKWKSKKEK